AKTLRTALMMAARRSSPDSLEVAFMALRSRVNHREYILTHQRSQGRCGEGEPVAVWRWSTKNWGYGEANNGPTPISDPCTTTCVASAAFFRIFTPAPPLPGYALRSILAPDLGCEERLPVHGTDPLFAWLRLEDHPQLATLAELL